MAVPAIPDVGKPWLSWAQGVDAEARKVAGKVAIADVADPATESGAALKTAFVAAPATPAAALGQVPGYDTAGSGKMRWFTQEEHVARALGWFIVTDSRWGGGADPTGVADASPAINAALTAAGAGSTVWLPPGTYKIASSVLAKANVRLVGAGRHVSTLSAAAGCTNGVILGASSSTANYFTAEHLGIDAGFTAGLSLNGVQMTNCVAPRIEHCRIVNVANSAVLLQGLGAGGGCADAVVSDTVINGSGLANSTTGHAIFIKDNSPRCEVSGNRITGVKGGMGVGLAGSAGTGYPTHWRIENNVITMVASTTGFECIGVTAGCVHGTSVGNVGIGSQDNGQSISADFCVVTGNVIDGALNHGIAIAGSYCTVVGNTIRNVGQQADASYGFISLGGVTGCTVFSNVGVDDQATPTTSLGVKFVTSPGGNRAGLNYFKGLTGLPYSGQITTGASQDVVLDLTTNQGLTLRTLYVDTLNASTTNGAITIGNTVGLNGLAFSGSGRIGTAQHVFGSNLPASRPNRAGIAVFGQVADIDVWLTTAADNVTTTVVGGVTRTGRIYSTDGITTKDVGDVTGKTSAQIDALFTATPGDGTLAAGLLSAAPVHLARRAGKWTYVNATQIA